MSRCREIAEPDWHAASLCHVGWGLNVAAISGKGGALVLTYLLLRWCIGCIHGFDDIKNGGIQTGEEFDFGGAIRRSVWGCGLPIFKPCDRNPMMSCSGSSVYRAQWSENHASRSNQPNIAAQEQCIHSDPGLTWSLPAAFTCSSFPFFQSRMQWILDFHSICEAWSIDWMSQVKKLMRGGRNTSLFRLLDFALETSRQYCRLRKLNGNRGLTASTIGRMGKWSRYDAYQREQLFQKLRPNGLLLLVELASRPLRAMLLVNSQQLYLFLCFQSLSRFPCSACSCFILETFEERVKKECADPPRV